MDQSPNYEQELSVLKEFVSNWSEKMVNGQKFDELFSIEGLPLSWFFRPILYSSLLPAPFPTNRDIINHQKINDTIIKAYSFISRKYVVWHDQVQFMLRDKNISSAASDGKILFLTFANYLDFSKGIFRFEPLITKIKEQRAAPPFIIVADPLTHFPKRGTEFQTKQPLARLYQYYDSTSRKKAKQLAFSLAEKWRTLPESAKREFLRHGDTEIYPCLQHNLNFLYSREFIYTTLKYYFAFQNSFKFEKARAVVLSAQNNIFEKCAIAAAQKMNLPVFLIQHGLSLGTIPTIDTPANVTIAVFGEKYKADVIKWGINPKNVEVTGPLIFEGIENFVGKKKETGRSILLATSPLVEDRLLDEEAYFSRVKKILADGGTVTRDITIKAHPREKNVHRYRQLLRELGLSEKVSQVIDRRQHYQLIQNCDLLATFGSTVALEGMIIGRPTITIDIFGQHNPLNKTILNSQATTLVRYDQNLAPYLTRLFAHDEKEEEARKLVAELCYKVDGQAAERIVNCMKKHLGEDFHKFYKHSRGTAPDEEYLKKSDQKS